MQKIAALLLVGIMLEGCSASRHAETIISEQTNSENILYQAEAQNITKEGFFIQKADLEFVSKGTKDKFTANIKFEKPDRYLISLRSRTGIEGARIYISGDSIKMNDRINKKLYEGSSGYLIKNYGLSQILLPIIFGDIILDNKSAGARKDCVDGKFKLQCYVKGLELNYLLSCKEQKLLSVEQNNSFNQVVFSMEFKKFKIYGGKRIPAEIEISDSQYDTQIKMKILRIQYPWSGNISFIPGKGYELIQLL